MKQSQGIILAAVCTWLYALAFFLPAIAPFSPEKPQSGAFAFISAFLFMRWLVADGDFRFAFMVASWLANPVFWLGLGCALAGSWRSAAFCGAVAVALGLALLTQVGSMVAPQPGYWLWVASAAVLSGGSLLLARRAPSPEPAKPIVVAAPKYDESQLCYLCGNLLKTDELMGRVCHACRR